MTVTAGAATLSEQLWSETEAIRTAIEQHPFVTGLADGTLPREVFTGYLAQDARYLIDYGRALAGLAMLAPDPDDLVLFAECAAGAIVVERQLHAAHVDDLAGAEMNPTNRAYTSYLRGLLTDGYPVALAGILPCFWLYAHVGETLLARAGTLTGHPYADWIGTYADPAFAELTRRVRAALDREAAQVGPDTLSRMRDAFRTASQFEWMFFDAAWRQETWPI